jgi:hypothetical protein
VRKKILTYLGRGKISFPEKEGEFSFLDPCNLGNLTEICFLKIKKLFVGGHHRKEASTEQLMFFLFLGAENGTGVALQASLRKIQV